MRILLIEEDEFLREIFKQKLQEEFNGTVDISKSCKRALKLLQTEKPYDVIVSGCNLKRSFSLDILGIKIRNSEATSFIFFTNLIKPTVSFQFDNCGIVEHSSFQLLFAEIRKRAFPELYGLAKVQKRA